MLSMLAGSGFMADLSHQQQFAFVWLSCTSKLPHF
jgi:hypothetical protein